MATTATNTYQTALVTGASGGIGEQFARQLAARGTGLVLAARSETRLRALAADLRSTHPGPPVDVAVADLSHPGAADALVEHLDSTGVAVDLLVNNAGVGHHGDFLTEDTDAVTRMIQLNCTSLVALTSRLLPGMVSRGRGGIINVSSTSAFQPVPTMAVYAATKAFVLSFTEALWVETRGSGVHVLALCPGSTETGFFEAAGTEFLRRGRQTPAEVAAFGLRSLDARHGPTVVSGAANRLSSMGYRVLPRPVMARMAGFRIRHT